MRKLNCRKSGYLRVLRSTGAFAASVAIFAGVPAFAAPAPDAAALDQNDTAAPAPSADIVVTARRKEESLVNVPASITAYSADFMKKANIQTFADYATKIPNLTFEYGQGTDYSTVGFVGGRQTTIRGVAGANTTAYYINDTPVPASISPQTLDLDRIEVLKGPQGTLFGASSMGGNLRFITKQPSLNSNSYTLQLQGGGTRGDGFDTDDAAVANVVLVPGSLSLNTAVGYTRESGFISRRFPDASGNLVTKGGQGRGDTYSASAALRWKVTNSLEASLSGFGQIYNLHGFPAAYVPLPAYKPVSYTLDRDRDVQEFSHDKWGLGAFVLRYSGEGFNVVSSTSYFARRTREREDLTEANNYYLAYYFPPYDPAAAGNPALYTDSISEDRRFTEENRLSFDEGAILPHLSGIVGVFYQHKFTSFYQPAIPVPELGAAGFDPNYITDQKFDVHQDDTAVFGELYYEIVPKLTLTVGIRHYWNTQKADPLVATGIFNSPGGDYYPARKYKQSGWVPKLVLSYKPSNDATFYVSASKGFRPGGSQPRLPDFCQADLSALGRTQDDTEQFDSDTLWSYEVGAKRRIAGGRLNVSAAGFQIDWSNIQQQVQLSNCGLNFVSNAGKARLRGGELAVNGRPIADVPFTIQLGLGYIDGVLKDPGLIPQAANTQLTEVPRWTGTIGANYEHPISDEATFFISADYSYTSSVKVVNSAGGFLERQPFNFVNGNAGVRFGHSQILVYAKNLLDERLNLGALYPAGFERVEVIDVQGGTQRLPRAAVSRPRQLGVQYRLDF